MEVERKWTEATLRELRKPDSDRAAARAALADLLLAHELAEEHVYPSLRRKRVITAGEEEHSEEEHAEGDQALLALLECKGTDTDRFDRCVEELGKALAHHLGEEE